MWGWQLWRLYTTINFAGQQLWQLSGNFLATFRQLCQTPSDYQRLSHTHTRADRLIRAALPRWPCGWRGCFMPFGPPGAPRAGTGLLACLQPLGGLRIPGGPPGVPRAGAGILQAAANETRCNALRRSETPFLVLISPPPILYKGKNKSRKNSLYGRYTRYCNIRLFPPGAAVGPGALFAGLCGRYRALYAGPPGICTACAHQTVYGRLRAFVAVRAVQLYAGTVRAAAGHKKARHSGRAYRSRLNSLGKCDKHHDREKQDSQEHHNSNLPSLKLYHVRRAASRKRATGFFAIHCRAADPGTVYQVETTENCAPSEQ